MHDLSFQSHVLPPNFIEQYMNIKMPTNRKSLNVINYQKKNLLYRVTFYLLDKREGNY